MIQLCWTRSALFGGTPSLAAAVYTQHRQDRLQRVACEVAKWETVYAEFVMSASSLQLNAYTKDEMGLSGDVVVVAEAGVRAIVEIFLKPFLKPGTDLRQLAKKALSNNLDSDPLMTFSAICRTDLDNVRRL